MNFNEIKKLEKDIKNISRLNVDEKLKLKLMERVYNYYCENDRTQEIQRIRRKLDDSKE